MAYDEWYALGRQLRRFLLGGTDQPRVVTTGRPQASGPRYPLAMASVGDRSKAADRSGGVFGIFNQAARLKPGHLLVVFLGRLACYQVDPESGEIEYLFTLGHEQSPFIWRALADRDGRIYCTMSGVKDPASPTQDALFGMAGAILRVNHRLAEVEAIAVGESVVDPCSLQFLDEARLLVCDFNGFGGSGSVYSVDRTTGELRTLAEGGLLRDPVSAMMDKDGMIWVANSYMHYYYPQRGGVLEKDDGEVLRIDPDGNQTVIVPRQSPAAGSIVGIHPSNAPDQVIAIKGDWPTMETGAVLRVNKKSKKVETLLTASPGDPQFFSTHVGLRGDVLWVGESYKKRLIGYDLKKNTVVKTIDFSSVMGAYCGVSSSFEGIESVSVIPEDLRV